MTSLQSLCLLIPSYVKPHDLSKDTVSREIKPLSISPSCLISVKCYIPEINGNIPSKGKERILRLCLKAEALLKSDLLGGR